MTDIKLGQSISDAFASSNTQSVNIADVIDDNTNFRSVRSIQVAHTFPWYPAVN